MPNIKYKTLSVPEIDILLLILNELEGLNPIERASKGKLEQIRAELIQNPRIVTSIRLTFNEISTLIALLNECEVTSEEQIAVAALEEIKALMVQKRALQEAGKLPRPPRRQKSAPLARTKTSV